jgi:hypothetical protein
MRRRQFIAQLGCAAVAWPLDVRAQPSKVRQVGALLLGNADAESFRTELRDGLRKPISIEDPGFTSGRSSTVLSQVTCRYSGQRSSIW